MYCFGHRDAIREYISTFHDEVSQAAFSALNDDASCTRILKLFSENQLQCLCGDLININIEGTWKLGKMGIACVYSLRVVTQTLKY